MSIADRDVVDVALLVLRIVFGVLMAMHGLQKLRGWFSGGGLAGTGAWFASLGFANGRAAALAAGTSEVVGGLGIAAGLLTPLAACIVTGVMTTAAIVNHQDGGFWSAKKGWELNLYIVVVVWFVAVVGPGRWSLDHLIGWDLTGLVLGSAAVAVGVLFGNLTWTTRSKLGAP